MSIFGDIWNKIVGHPEATPSSAAVTTAQSSANAASPATPASTSISGVDVEAILETMAKAKGRPSNWRTSIVDLLTLVDLDSSLNARKELAQELNVHAGADGSAEQNIALHKAVMQKLEQNGGKVPDSLKG